LKARLSSAAEQEYAESALFYLERSPQAAQDFVIEVNAALNEIESNPKRYSPNEDDIRVKVLDTFPFSIYYQARVDEVWVLSISHQARRPEYWRDRL
jgi:plasmid stabilization system protein ParE